MNFIADTPEDVNGWVEGMKIAIVQEKTSVKFIRFIIIIIIIIILLLLLLLLLLLFFIIILHWRNSF